MTIDGSPISRVEVASIGGLALFLLSDFFKAATIGLGVDITALLGLLCVAFAVMRLAKQRFPIPRFYWMVPAFLVVMVTPTLYADTFVATSSFYANDKLFRLATVGIVSALVAPVLVRTSQELIVLAGSILLVAVVMSGFMLVEILQGIDLWRWQIYGISTISLGRGFGYGMVAACLFIFMSESKSRSLAFMGLMIWFSVMVIGVGNRQGLLGALLAVGVGWLFMMAKKGSGIKAKTLIAVSVAVIGGMLSISLIPENALARVASPIESGLAGDASTQARLRLFSEAWDLFLSQPLGAGLGAFASLGLKSGVTPVNYPHNVFLEVLAEGGVIAFVFLCAMVVYAYLNSFKYARRTIGGVFMVMLLILSLVVASLSSDLVGNKILLAAVAIAVCLPRLGGRRRSDLARHAALIDGAVR